MRGLCKESDQICAGRILAASKLRRTAAISVEIFIRAYLKIRRLAASLHPGCAPHCNLHDGLVSVMCDRAEPIDVLPADDNVEFALTPPQEPDYSGYTWNSRLHAWVLWRNGRAVAAFSVPTE